MVKYLVSTTMGNSIMDPGYETYVQVTRERFLRKVAGDLKPGDMVLFAKPFTRTDLEDVDPYLTKSPRYAKAKDLLHDVNRNGTYMPKLRGMLIRGLANAGVINTENLESKILYESGNDFSKEEYKTMEGYLVNLLAKDGRPQISDAGVRNWLEGTVIAPRNWSLLETLAERLNPEFSDFEYASNDPAGIYFNYRLYVVLRQGVMRFLNQAKGIRATEGWEEGENLISITPEYQIVFNHFLKDFSMNYATARVTSISKMDRQRQMEHLKETDRLLGNGIVTKLPTHLKLPQKTFPELVEDSEIFAGYLAAASEDFDCGPLDFTTDEKILPTRITKWGLSSAVILPYLLECFEEELDSHMKFVKEETLNDKMFNGHLKDAARFSFGRTIRDAILLGKMDSFFSFDRGTMMKLLEAYFRTRTAIPNRVHDYVTFAKKYAIKAIEGKYSPYTREVKKEIEKRRSGLKEKYDLDYDVMGENTKGGMFFSYNIHPHKYLKLGVSPREFIENIITDKEKFNEIVKVAKLSLKPDAFLRTKKHTEDILKQYGLNRILDLRRQDFWFEGLL